MPVRRSSDVYRWEFEKPGKVSDIDVEGPLITNDTEMVFAAAAERLGLAYVLDIEAREYFAAGLPWTTDRP